MNHCFLRQKNLCFLMSTNFEETLEKIEEYENFQIAPLDTDILKRAEKIEVVLEMHDKLIVATSVHYNATLITKDEKIAKSNACLVIWQDVPYQSRPLKSINISYFNDLFAYL